MQHALLDLLRAALVPELGADVAAGTAGDVELRLVGVAALRALPDELAALVLDDLDLAVEAAHLAVVALGVELGVHDVVVDELHDREDRRQVVLHVRHLDVGDRASGRELLELRLERELGERVDLLRHVDVVGVGDVVLVRDSLHDAEALLQALGELVGRRLERSAVEGVVDVLGLLPLRGVLVELLHHLEAELLALGLGELLADHREDALPEPRVAERDRRVAAVEELVDLLALVEAREGSVLPENRRRVGGRPFQALMAAAEGAVAELAALVEEAPELLHVAVRGKRDVDEVDRDDALVEAAVVLRLAGLVVLGARDVAVAVARAVRREERAAAHARVRVAVPDCLALGELVLAHLLLADVVGHHALRRALRGELGQVPVGRVLADVLLLEHVDELGERGRYVDALLVLDALDALVQHLLDDHREVVALALAPRLAEVHVDGDERRLSVRGHERDDLVLDRLHALLDLLADAELDDLVEVLLRHLDACELALALHLLLYRLPGDVDERREVRERDRLAAVLVGCDLRDDLRRDVAGRGERLRLLDHRLGDHRAVLQHVLEVHEVAVVHVLRVVVHVVEVDDALLVCLDDVGWEEETRRDVLRDLARHVVALHGVDRRVLVGVLLLDVLVVALDEREYLLVRRVGLAEKLLLVAVYDVALRDLPRAELHELRLDDVLDLLDVHRAVASRAHARDFLRDKLDTTFRKRILVVDGLRRLANRVLDLSDVERDFLSAAGLLRNKRSAIFRI